VKAVYREAGVQAGRVEAQEGRQKFRKSTTGTPRQVGSRQVEEGV